nr:rRNA-processing protein fcf2-like [Ipomoea batatas]
MAEPNPIIGLTWEPKLPGLPASAAKPKPHHSQSPETSSALYRPRSELIDGLYVPPSDPKKLKKLLRKEVKDTAGKNWFDMPAPSITPELKKDLQLLKVPSLSLFVYLIQNAFDMMVIFMVGVVIEPASEFYSSRLSKKERKATLAEELISDTNLVEYRKRKVREIEEQKRPGGVDKWKIKGQQSRKRAKHRRH